MASSKNNQIRVMVSLVRTNACKVELGLDLFKPDPLVVSFSLVMRFIFAL